MKELITLPQVGISNAGLEDCSAIACTYLILFGQATRCVEFKPDFSASWPHMLSHSPFSDQSDKGSRAVVVAQLVERLLLTPEVHGSNQITGKFYIKHLFTVNTIENAKITKKRPGMAHFLKL